MSLPTLESLEPGHNVQIDNREVHKALGEINITRCEEGLNITATVLMTPSNTGEGWQTGVAIDSSYSMKRAFGGKNLYFSRPLTDGEREEFLQKNFINIVSKDGQDVAYFTEAGYAHLLSTGLLYQEDEKKEVEEVCRAVIPMLAEELDADGGTTVIYWAGGQDGSAIRELGDFTAESAAKADYDGMADDWGYGTKIMPAIRYFLDRFADADMGFYVFITDGKLDDIEEVKEFTKQLSRDVDAGKVKPVKLVLIGVGPEIDESQLEDLDDLPDTCDLPVDIWDHKVAAEMRSVMDIFAELVDENKAVAPSGIVQDDQGNEVRDFSDGLPSLIKFTLPLTAKGFKIVLPNGAVIEQPVLA